MAGGETGVDQRRFQKEAKRRADATPAREPAHDTRRDVWVAYAPYAIIIAVFALAQISWLPFKEFLDERTREFSWPGLDIVNGDGRRRHRRPSSSTGPAPAARCCCSPAC
jgi:hypothetical protein